MAPKPWTVDEFLAWERTQEARYEFLAGIVRMMTGGTLDHAAIKGNVYAALRQVLRGKPCEVFVQGPKVATADAVLYSDIVVTRARELRAKDDTVHEPVLVVEVLSRSTEGWDRGGKGRAYQEVPGLRRYVLISQDERRVEPTRGGSNLRAGGARAGASRSSPATGR